METLYQGLCASALHPSREIAVAFGIRQIRVRHPGVAIDDDCGIEIVPNFPRRARISDQWIGHLFQNFRMSITTQNGATAVDRL
jgi:hypothetical protein